MIINKSGVAIRMGMDDLRVMGRNTQGVRMINLKNNDEIAAVAKVMMDKEVEEETEETVENKTECQSGTSRNHKKQHDTGQEHD